MATAWPYLASSDATPDVSRPFQTALGRALPGIGSGGVIRHCTGTVPVAVTVVGRVGEPQRPRNVNG